MYCEVVGRLSSTLVQLTVNFF